jgi:hypothetical protein
MSFNEKEVGEIADIISDLSSSSQPNISESSSQETKAAGKKLIELDGEIGVLKSQLFVPMTNFAVRCTGYVVDDSSSTVARGFLFRVIPKDRVHWHCEDIEVQESEDNQAR